MREGLIKAIPPSDENAKASIHAAEKWVEESEENLKAHAHNSSVLSAYLAMFHSARAILFRDGFREKSHYCLARYIEEKYVKTGKLESKWINLLDHQREIRHGSQYDTSFHTTEKEAENAVNTAKEFSNRMRQLLEK